MARNEHGLVAHGPQALGDAVDELLMVALREIGAPSNAAGKEQHIAHKGAVDLGAWNTTCPGVAGAVAHIQRLVAHLHRVAVVQPACRREVLRGRKAEHRALLRQPVNPELIARVRPHDGRLQALGQLARAARMVDMGVREQIWPSVSPRRSTSPSSTSRSPPGQSRRPGAWHRTTRWRRFAGRGNGNGEVMQHGGDYWWLPSLCVSLSENECGPKAPIFKREWAVLWRIGTMSKPYLFLVRGHPLRGAIATSAMKSSHGFTRLVPSIFTVLMYCVSFYALSQTVAVIPTGIAYAIWSGWHCPDLTGWLDRFQQTLDAPALIGMGLIGAGALWSSMSKALPFSRQG